jgi:hypothetical protein
VLRELDPSYRADTIPPKRLRRVKLFSNGELNRLIADALRRAEEPLASSDVADAIVEAKGYGRDSIHALTRRSAPTSPTCSATSAWLRPGTGLPPAGRCQTKRKSPPTEAALLPGFELCDPAIQLPQLNVVTVYKLFRSLFCCVIVRAKKVHGTENMAIPTHDVRAIMLHALLPIRREHNELSVTDGCRG